MGKKSLCGLSPEDILLLAEDTGISVRAATLISNAIYKKRIRDIQQIKDVSKKLLDELNTIFISGLYDPESFCKSIDGTIKYLFRNSNGLLFETVFIPEKNRNTVCVSTQSGCRMGCPFCMTGRYGFHGNLSVAEIILQILGIPEAEKITHVVFMGMGEPLDNIENVLKSCEIITSIWGMALSPRNVTVSTVGITPSIKAFLERSSCNLTLSLFSPFPEERYYAVPAEKKYPALDILRLMRDYPLKKKRRISIGYVMIENLNDTDRHLNGLKELLSGSHIRINLIPYHPLPDDNNTSTSAEKMQKFRHELMISGISASVRKSRGIDISAACGLLSAGMKKKHF